MFSLSALQSAQIGKSFRLRCRIRQESKIIQSESAKLDGTFRLGQRENFNYRQNSVWTRHDLCSENERRFANQRS